jgi:hypothetical protein
VEQIRIPYTVIGQQVIPQKCLCQEKEHVMWVSKPSLIFRTKSGAYPSITLITVSTCLRAIILQSLFRLSLITNMIKLLKVSNKTSCFE